MHGEYDTMRLKRASEQCSDNGTARPPAVEGGQRSEVSLTHSPSLFVCLQYFGALCDMNVEVVNQLSSALKSKIELAARRLSAQDYEM